MFAAKYQLKQVTVAILKCMLFNSLYCLVNSKSKSFKQCFYQNTKHFAVDKVTTRVRILSFSSDAGPQSFCHSFIALSMIMLFEVYPEIRSSGVSIRSCCYGNHTADSKPILKLFSTGYDTIVCI